MTAQSPDRDEVLTSGQQRTSDRLDRAVGRVQDSVRNISDTQDLLQSLSVSVPDLAESMREIAAAYRESTAAQVAANEEARRQNATLARSAHRNGFYIGVACLLVLLVGLGVYRINQGVSRVNSVVTSVQDGQTSGHATLTIITDLLNPTTALAKDAGSVRLARTPAEVACADSRVQRDIAVIVDKKLPPLACPAP